MEEEKEEKGTCQRNFLSSCLGVKESGGRTWFDVTKLAGKKSERQREERLLSPKKEEQEAEGEETGMMTGRRVAIVVS